MEVLGADGGWDRAVQFCVVVDSRGLPCLKDSRRERRVLEAPAAADGEAGDGPGGGDYDDRPVGVVPEKRRGRCGEYSRRLLGNRCEKIGRAHAGGDERGDASESLVLVAVHLLAAARLDVACWCHREAPMDITRREPCQRAA